MKKIHEHLFVGNQQDYENSFFDDDFSFVLAAKEPFHRQAIGYTGRACDKSHNEYLIARRDNNKLILNMVDASSSLFFDKSMIDTALDYIEEEIIDKNKNVLIVCNKGESRSASLGLLYLIKHGIIKSETLEDCEVEFLRLYPNYNPGSGIREFVKEHFKEYTNDRN